MAIAGVVEAPVETVESDVGEQGRNDAPLRGTERRRSELTLLHHPGLEKSFDQTENVAIGNLVGHACHDDVVRNIVEEPFDIGIEDIGVPEPMEFDDPLDRPMTVACRPETVGVVVKDPLKERTEELPQHLLSNTVADRRDTQRPRLAVTLGDMDATQGQGLESPVLEATHQGQQVLQEIALIELDADLVDPRRTAIAFDVAEGFEHEGLSYTPGQ